MTLAVGLRDCLGAGRKTRNRLLFVVLVDFEIILRQVAYVVALFVGHHGIDEHEFCFLFDDRHDLLVGGSGCLRRRGSRLLLRAHRMNTTEQSVEQGRSRCHG